MCIRTLILLGLLASFCRTAQAQQTIKPRLLLIFDTSGSMRWDNCGNETNGDGSAECPGDSIACNPGNGCGSQSTCGNGVADDSRMYRVKEGVSQVISAYPEAEYALARFKQAPDGTPSCAHWGWLGADCEPNDNASPNCDCERDGVNFDFAEVLVDFAANNTAQILQWMNHNDDAVGTPAAGSDIELRASLYTPIAGSISSMQDHLIDNVIPGDVDAACRNYGIVMITDGFETCSGDPPAAAAAACAAGIPVHVIGFAFPSGTATLNAIADNGCDTTCGETEGICQNTANQVDNADDLSIAIASIIAESLLIEECNLEDDDCDGDVDEDFPSLGETCTAGAGECEQTGVFVCKGDGTGTECSATALPPGTEVCNNLDDDCDGAIDEGFGGACSCIPGPEVCNGADDDCDGTVDEGLGNLGSCGSDIGQCVPGTLQCISGSVSCEDAEGPFTEVCDCLDNNCDTIVDQISRTCYEFGTGCDLVAGTCEGVCQLGLQTCTAATCPGFGACNGDVGPGAEVCNGIDDDCDGEIDDGASFGCTDYASCGIVASCAPCDPPPAELCNGEDEDCDGTVDEEAVDVGGPCGSDVGACEPGILECIDGSPSCEGATGSSDEECDGIDNDCDGSVDETFPEDGLECGKGESICGSGMWNCVAGTLVCVGATEISPEICDCSDNDCDGATDEGDDICPAGTECLDCSCRIECGTEEFQCPGGFTCNKGFCVPDPCSTVDCGENKYCSDGRCLSLCLGVTCDFWEECVGGACVDVSCSSDGCADGEICVDHECLEDPCPDGRCEEHEYCQAGECYSLCACADGEICRRGECLADPCADVDCPGARICDNGTCMTDPCYEVECNVAGEICFQGRCQSDPCIQTSCPADFACALQGSDAICLELEKGPGLLATGSGGCSCALGAAP